MQTKRIILAVKILVILAVFGWGIRLMFKLWNEVPQHEWKLNYLMLILAGVCYIVAHIPAAIYWRYAMQTLGQNPGVFETFRAYYIGHLGKYVPGKVWVLFIRSALLNREKTKISTAAASIFMETMTMMAVGAFVGTMIVLLWYNKLSDWLGIDHFTLNWLALFAFLALVGTILPILPPIFRFVAKKCRIELEGLRFKTLAVGWLLNIPVWIMLGVSLWLTMLGFGMKSESIFTELPYCTMTIAFSVVLGFASMIPAGFGVRGWAMSMILVPFFVVHSVGTIDPTVMAGVIVTVHRIISIFSESVVSGILLPLVRS